MDVVWRGLGTAMVVAHFVFLGYLIVGGFLAWRYPWTIVTHVLAAIWGALIIVTRVPCPLTALQNTFREHAGQRTYREGFISHYVKGHLYPASHEQVVQVAILVVVLVSWAGFAVRHRRRGASGPSKHGAASGATGTAAGAPDGPAGVL